MNWQSYSAMCISKNIENPYENEVHYNRAYGIKEVEEPLSIRPKHKSSIDAHCKVVNAIRETRKKIKKADVPKKPKAVKEKKPSEPKIPKQPKIRKSDEEKAATKKARLEREYAQRKKKRIERRIAKGLPPVRINLKAMSEEERGAHRRALQKAERERQKEKMETDPEFRAKKKAREQEYQRRYAMKNRGRGQRWAKSNPEKIKEINRLWREKNREKLRANAKLRREKKKAEDPNFLIREREKAKELRMRKRNGVNMPWSAENGCAA